MKTFKQKLLNDCQVEYGSMTRYANIAGYKQGQGLKNVLENEDKEFDCFEGILNLIKEIYPDEIHSKIKEFALGLNPKKKTARSILEYATINRLDDLKMELINRMIKCGNKESEERASVYLLDHQTATGELKGIEALNSCNYTQFKYVENQIFAKMIQIYEYYLRRDFGSVDEIVEGLETDIESVKEPFVRNSYFTRLGLVLTGAYLANGEINKSRQFAHMGINNTEKPVLKAMLKLQLGNSYIFENYNLANMYLKNARKLCLENNVTSKLKQVESSMNFLNNVWNKTPEFIDVKSTDPSDLHEMVFYCINKGNSKEAQNLLSKIDVNELSSQSKGFNSYYRYLITKEEKYLYESIKCFREAKDKFFITLPMIKLEEIGVPDYVIKMAIA